MLYELATGKRLFSRPSSSEMTAAILNEEPKPPRDLDDRISPGLEAVILKALDKDPDLRHQTAKDLLVDLERLQLRLGSRPSGSDPTRQLAADAAASVPGEHSAARARPWRWVGAPVLALAVLAGTAWLARPTAGLRIAATQLLLEGRGNSQNVTTDGTRLYRVVRRDGQSILQQVPISGGDPLETTLAFRGDVVLQGAIPGESALLVTASREGPRAREASADRPLWRQPVPGGVPQRIEDLVARSADASPDGRSLALIRGSSLVLTSIAGSSPRELLSFGRTLDRVHWSPDGRRLRFQSSGPEDDRDWIWEISTSGGEPRALWEGHWGDWTNDGRNYVFDRPPSHDLFYVTESVWARWWPGTPQLLTSGDGTFAFYGSSRDGDRLVVNWNRSVPAARGTLYRYDPETQAFAPALGGESARYAEPSPDGEWLAWVLHPEGTLWISRPDGTHRRQLTTAPSLAYLPRWSPEGKRLAYVSQPDPSAPREIRIVAADGSEAVLVVRPESRDEDYWDACWLPDGSIILSRLSRPGLFRFEPTTGRLAPVPGAERLRWPKCSRQGDVLASGRLRRRGETEWRDLRDLRPVQFGYDSWTRDGRLVYGIDSRGVIKCLNPETGEVRVVTDASPLGLGGWGGNTWMGLDAEDRPLVLSSPSVVAGVHVVYLKKP